MRRLASTLLLLGLAACSAQAPHTTKLDALDAELTNANAADPLVTAALAAPIMSDPALAQSANADAVRPPRQPDVGAVPSGIAAPAPIVKDAATLGAVAEQAPRQRAAGCAQTVGYSAVWSTRLPAALPLYPDAEVAEAAGTDANGCALRVVSFVSDAPPARVLQWYRTRARVAGYSAHFTLDSGTAQLAGTRGDSLYVIYAASRAGGGSTIDLVVDGG